MDIVAAIILGVVGSLIAAEAYANGSRIADALIRRAVRRLPEHEQPRFLEEWRADNTDFPGNGQKVFHAIGCCVGASAVAKALARPKIGKRSSEGPERNHPRIKQTDENYHGFFIRGKRDRIRLEIYDEINKRIGEIERTIFSNRDCLEKIVSKNSSSGISLPIYKEILEPDFIQSVRNKLLHSRDDKTLQKFKCDVEFIKALLRD